MQLNERLLFLHLPPRELNISTFCLFSHGSLFCAAGFIAAWSAGGDSDTDERENETAEASDQALENEAPRFRPPDSSPAGTSLHAPCLPIGNRSGAAITSFISEACSH